MSAITLDSVLGYFSQINQYPRPSGKEDKIRDFLV